MNRLPVNQILLLVLLYIVWNSPSIISQWGLVLALSLVGSFLLAQLFIIAIEYVLIRYCANKSGIIFLAATLCVVGTAIAYASWMQENYSVLNIAWIIIYTLFGVLHAAYNRNLGGVVRDMILYGEYLLIALFAAVLFQTYINSSAMGAYNLDYAGVDAEMIWFVAMTLLATDILYKLYLELVRTSKKTISSLKKK